MRKNMISKKIASVILAGAIVLCAAACGTKDNVEDAPSKEASEEQGQVLEETEEEKENEY